MGGGSVDVDTDSVEYTPYIFFPEDCTGAVPIEIKGNLVDEATTGTLKSYGMVWDSGDPQPFDDDVHTLSITTP